MVAGVAPLEEPPQPAGGERDVEGRVAGAERVEEARAAQEPPLDGRLERESQPALECEDPLTVAARALATLGRADGAADEQVGAVATDQDRELPLAGESLQRSPSAACHVIGYTIAQ